MLEVSLWTDDSEQWQHSRRSVHVRTWHDLERDVVCELRTQHVQEQLLERGLLVVSLKSADSEHWRC